ncbi:serine hydrolase domain-containing protein [Sphingomonas colocasiae]|uniref:Beta-lactamase family protein n=1 Tax=Sphingomonas colocasiae TaxID=1848973 RepID=A0ABS7PS75_9SPHN|nr:serine hydrolase domain-containing protein [Sphingomonas colocasiae]MBY8823834.1 beta-lactamase family protein [Sphingomonas colocasiae]
MPRLKSLLAALLLALGFAFTTPAAAQAETPAMRAALADVRAMVESAPGDTGLVVAVTSRERLLMVATHGYADIARRQPVTAETRFAIGSISKSFNAIVMMQLADEGRFDPDAPIARYLPDFHPRSRFPAITGHALLTHTAGLPNYLTHVASMRFLIAALDDFEPRYAPGAHFWYSNSGYQLLGYAAEKIDQRPFPLILQQRVFDRLGMTASAPQIDGRLRGQIATSYDRTPQGGFVEAPWFDYLASDGAIVSNAADMSAYARMLLARGDTPSGRLISARAFDRFVTPARDNYGYGVDVQDGGRVIAHGGAIAGFRAYLSAHLADGFGVVLLANGPLDRALRDRIIARLVQASGGKPAPAAAPPALRTEAADFVGQFSGPKGEVLRFATDAKGGLMLSEGGAALPLTRLGDQSWGLYVTPRGPRAFTFFRDDKGVVTDIVEGATGYVAKGAARPVEAPAAYHALVGHYRMHGEEGPDLHILVRNGRLMMAYADGDATPLEADGARFRMASPAHAPEWLAFDTMIDGQAQRLLLTGVPAYRVDLP